MMGFAKSTIAALCYANETDIDFHAIASELGQALWDNPHGTMNMHSQYDDFVIYDLPGLRICLAFTDLEVEFPGMGLAEDCAKLVMISVGSAPDDQPGSQSRAVSADTHDVLCRNLVDHIARQAPYDRAIDMRRDEVITEEIYDNIIERVVVLVAGERSIDVIEPSATEAPTHAPIFGAMPPLSEEAVVLETIPGPRHRVTRAARLGPVPSGQDLDWFDARFEAECAARDAALQAREAEYEAREAAEIAHEAARAARRRNGRPRAHAAASARADAPGRRAVEPTRPTPTHPAMAADAGGAAAQKTAAPHRIAGLGGGAVHLRPSAIFDEDVDAQPLVHRAAVNALNASMVAFALPVGAALLTLAVLGRESIGLSSRITALTGAYIGLTQGDGVAQLISYFS